MVHQRCWLSPSRQLFTLAINFYFDLLSVCIFSVLNLKLVNLLQHLARRITIYLRY